MTYNKFILLYIVSEVSFMNINICGNDLILTDVCDFKLSHTFECGQCFRWENISFGYPEYDEVYIGIAFGKVLKIAQKDNILTLFDTSVEDYENIWEHYFDLSRDYSRIKAVLSKDGVMRKAMEFGYGIHILNQDIWECIISFIISASNNIPRIKKIINLLCCNFGEKIQYQNKTYHSFPTRQKLSALTLDDIAVVRCGFRDKYILDAIKKADTDFLNSLKQLNNKNVKEKLMSIKGVGNKVAYCIMLFSLERYDSFPVDVWIKRVMEQYYFNSSETSISEIERLAEKKFGEYGGFAQQYLFFYGRENG